MAAWSPFNQMTIEEKQSFISANKEESEKWYTTLIENSGSLLEGVSSIVSSFKGNAVPETVVYNSVQPTTNNNIIYVMIAIAIIASLFFIIKK